ncbi:MAG: O-acetyl-ADP-ribose deacetylase [Ignavibacteriales bacterium]|nr:O-acetyl-ADP-ribose deacetylase [Ignavibacteriales bacterium]
MGQLEIIRGDITRLVVDAIVNAANNSLLGGGGVDGAIHRAAGPKLREECMKLGGCDTGNAKITKGYNLPSKYVIHTVGPVWQGGSHNEDILLASCYRSSFELAELHGMRTLAFPSISTGAYGFPVEKASTIALQEIQNAFHRNEALEKVTVVCFDQHTYDVYLENQKQLIND